MSLFEIMQGDVLDRLRELPDGSVNCCVTSPPYWGLRDYGTAKWDGGSPECDHQPTTGTQGPTGERADRQHTQKRIFGIECRKCGAVRIDKQIGLEATPELFVARIVEVFGEVRRVLAKDGTCWVNLGDSYANPSQSGGGDPTIGTRNLGGVRQPKMGIGHGLKPKDLSGIPWRVAFALQADGWYLRQDIIWSKPNPMPESIKDRCTKAHEYIFLLTKSQRYFWDAEAMKEPVSGNAHARGSGVNPKARVPSGWDTTNSDHHQLTGRYPRSKQNESFSAAVSGLVAARNKRSVWTIPTMPTPDAHFATFPIEIPELCILAGCPKGGLVLDPFSGAATTGLACLKNNRRYLGIELNPEYIAISHRRARKHFPLLIGGVA